MLSGINVDVFDTIEGYVAVVIWRVLDATTIAAFEPSFSTDKGIMWNWTEYEAEAVPNPALKIPKPLMNLGVMQTLVDKIKENLGIVAESITPKEIEATRYHLEDMRKIVFDSDWIEIQKGSPAQLIEREGVPNASL